MHTRQRASMITCRYARPVLILRITSFSTMNSKLTARLVGAASFVFLLGLVVGCSSSSRSTLPPAANDPNVVAVYAGEALTLDEFEERYARTVGTHEAASDDSLAEYEDFLERYVNFRLKVEAATEAGIAASSEIQNEIQSYRANLARPYLLEEEVVEPIVREIYDRRQKLNDVSHILLRVEPAAPPEDTLAVYRRLEAVRDSAVQGVDFGDLALRHSEDPSASAREQGIGYRGRLGYFTAGRMVEPFETYSYETPEGEVSPIFRTRFGYHILYVHDRREAVPDIRLAHIMMRPQPTAEDSAATLQTINEIRERIDAGESFEELAKEYSVDQQSAARGGDIGFISFDAPIHPSFKDPAFALEEPGDVSDVIETTYGYHIIQLKERRELQSFDDSYEELKQLASRLPRLQEAEEDLARDILAQHGASVDTVYVLTSLQDIPGDSLSFRLAEKSLPDETLSHPFATLGDSTYSLNDVSEYLSTTQFQRAADSESTIMAMLDGFLTKAAIDYEAARLEERDEEFARIMDEFRDGLVLFKFMEDSVWTAAETDTSALETYYDARRGDYWWPERTRVISLQSSSDSLLQVLGGRLDSGESLQDLYASFEDDTLNAVRVDTMMISEATESVYDRALELEAGQHTEPLTYRGGHILLVNDGVEEARQKTFIEARTQVVSEFQTVLEDRLIERLRERFNAHTFPDRLVGAFSAMGDPPQDGEMASGE